EETILADAYGILIKYQLFNHLTRSIQTHITNGIKGEIKDTPKPHDSIFNHTFNTIIASNAIVVRAAATKAQDLGYIVQMNDTLITGNTEEAAQTLTHTAMRYNGDRPLCMIQGGETTVKIMGNGKGGRNQHFVLAALNELK